MSKAIKIVECQNCGTLLQGSHCHVCGQSAKEPRRAVIALVQDVFVDTLAIDGKLARTFGLLLTRPGRLARRYLDGRRVNYSPPFRLYLFTSVFFFFFAFLLSGADQWNGGNDTQLSDPEVRKEIDAALDESELSEKDREDVKNALDTLAIDAEDEKARDQSTEPDTHTKNAADTGRTKIELPPWEDVVFYGPEWLEAYVKRVWESGQRAIDDPRLFIAQLKEELPRVLLLAPIFYSLILFILYIYRRKVFVYDHLVVSLYMHAALYAYLLLAMVITRIPGFGWLAIIPIFWGMLQPYAVFRQAYRSNWFSVIIKGFVSSMVYLLGVALLIVFGLSYSLYQS